MTHAPVARRSFLSSAFATVGALCLLSLEGCASAIPIIGSTLLDIINVIQQARTIVDALNSAEKLVPGLTAAQQAAWNKAVNVCLDALAAASDLANGGHALTQSQIDAAFAAFADAWKQLSALAVELGVVSKAGAMLVGSHRGATLETPRAALPHPVQLRS